MTISQDIVRLCSGESKDDDFRMSQDKVRTMLSGYFWREREGGCFQDASVESNDDAFRMSRDIMGTMLSGYLRIEKG